ncbi:unnamed protein product [Nippostrongylus brasiliensis]|uniref:Uncharacterized protein n=1 Tax=Nippostrongylus brasiliensis TaxID=27835 RepID=A0A158R259_NIPBR|nr:unnamed protein product [Nippostrongylus brasiliensis]
MKLYEGVLLSAVELDSRAEKPSADDDDQEINGGNQLLSNGPSRKKCSKRRLFENLENRGTHRTSRSRLILNDDKATRLVEAIVLSLSSFSIRLIFDLPNAPVDMGWIEHRPVDGFVIDSIIIVLQTVVGQTSFWFETRTLHVILHA